ncbi:Protein CBG22121 [Caenorhabditis briggsae]|uniref:Protein CBG22121 n=1 Tax=Caenorhabditis briggsae TaxID=6238 RepID=A8Y1K5_CAEBR|nr:Protein CBG22121 [Caenorhabditis briggsae]CAP38775.1 Protein CBG22121 [Caenorhabditis briggsae]
MCNRENQCFPLANTMHGSEEAIIAFHNHLLDLFGTTVTFLYVGSDYDVIRQLRNVTACEIGMEYLFTQMRTLENFLTASPVFKFIHITARTTEEQFNPESKLYQAESIQIDQRDHTFPAILHRYQGRQAVLRCTHCNLHHLMDFVKKWKSGEGFQNLEYLKIKIICNGVPQLQIFNEIGARYIDATKQPPAHSVPRVYIECNDDEQPNTEPIISHAYRGRSVWSLGQNGGGVFENGGTVCD